MKQDLDAQLINLIDMSKLIDYILAFADRGECKCGKCIGVGNKPDPTGHTADVFMFKVVSKTGADKDTLKRLVRAHKGCFAEIDLFDGKEHSYIEIGGWIGDQGLALLLMGLGNILGCWKLLTPNNMMPDLPDDIKAAMAGSGMITIQATNPD